VDDKIPRIPFNKPFIVGKELYNIAQAVLVESHLSGDGPFTKRCHQWLEERLGCARAFLTHSCTGAIEMAALLCDIQPGDEVIMPSFTFVSAANAFVLRGGIPVFVDIRPDTLNLNEELIEQAITEHTKAIVPMHYSGVACAMDRILDLARRYTLWVIEDAAQAFLSTYKGRYLGTLGNFGCLSFHETKNIISGEGGALIVNDPAFIERAEIIREKGTNRNKFFRGEVDKYTWVDLGSSFLPGELIGAFLHAQLEQADKIISARLRTFHLYCDLLQPLGDKGLIRLPMIPENCACNGHLSFIITRSFEERTRLIEFLRGKGIWTVFHYVPLHSSSRYGRVSGGMEVTDDLSRRLLRLPMYHEMRDEEVHKVVDGINEFYDLSTGAT
jgi:dTDP-4-amino-4,6-dideoxygalactose transaminase